ncbi:hypothetical protein T10_4623 [Trichinella papuae]|uniref:Uncharacterized protein n=1 Tax=Trichinella papuae TaxID=268474 RepID=A0A0V1MB08_9BILA|nr:hypothetical protein T10_4623 [Trichinella papuae]
MHPVHSMMGFVDINGTSSRSLRVDADFTSWGGNRSRAFGRICTNDMHPVHSTMGLVDINGISNRSLRVGADFTSWGENRFNVDNC